MEMVLKPCQDLFLHPILVHSIIEKKENTRGTPKKNQKKTRSLFLVTVVIKMIDMYSRCQFHQHFTNAFCADILAPKNTKLEPI